jgi:hypothetical protein
MKTSHDASQKRRPYNPPVVKRQDNLKLITLLSRLSPNPQRTANRSH